MKLTAHAKLKCLFTSIVIFTVLIQGLPLLAGNPLVPDVGMADPHIYIFNNKAYLYATRDADPTAKSFVMPDWNIWSSNDLVNWELETTIYPTQTYMGKSTNCWATDIAERNGQYYFYFSNGNVNTGVMKAPSPLGPFVDALNKPLLPEDLTPGKEYDPTLLIDEDNKAYIVFGHYRSTDKDLNYYIAQLGTDMVSLAEEPKEISIIGDMDVLGGNDKPNLHKRNGIYYLSAGTHYATSTNIYGPYTRRGNSGNDIYGLNSRAHGNYFKWNNQWFHTWCHFHLGKDVGRYRESYITYLHYRENGEMLDDVDFLEKHFSTGVGQYDASWDKIEAEWYMAATDIRKKEKLDGGFEIQKIKNSSSLFFPKIKNLEAVTTVSFRVSSLTGGTIEVRSDDAKGQILATANVPKTGEFNAYQTIESKIKTSKGIKDIYLTFKGKGDDILHLDWFRFGNEPVWSENFENINPGDAWYGNPALKVTADGGVGNSRCLRVEYDVRTNPSGTTVKQFSQAVTPAREYTLQYDIYYESNWVSTMGGKFHGLTPKTHVTGCKQVEPHKWSARITLVNRTPSLYLYDQNKNSKCGRQIRQSSLTMEKEHWYSVCLYVKVNSSASNSDGIAEIYVNGKLESRMENVQFHAEDGEHTLIQNFLFSTFLGGGRDGAIESYQYIHYDNFAVVPGKSIRETPDNSCL